MPVPAAPPLYTGMMPTCSVPMLPSGIMSAPPSSVAASVPVVALGTDTRSTFISLGAPLSSAPPIVDTKAVPVATVVTSAGASSTSQEPAGGSTGQSSAMVVPVAAPSTPTVVIKQPEPVRPYTGTSSYKAYKEYFERICVCNDRKTPTECARHLLVAMDGVAPEAVRGLKAEQDTDLAVIWDTLARRFGFVDEPQRAMRHFDVRKQLDGESVAVFEQGLRTLHGEAWPGVDFKSPDADSRLRRKFVDGLMDGQIQTYLRLHATSGDFPTTVAKARQYEDADKLCRTAKKPAIRTASVSDYSLDATTQAILDGVKAHLLGDRGREGEVNTAQVSNPTPTRDPRARGLLPARDRRRLAVHRQEALPVVSHLIVLPSGSKTK